MTAPAKQMSMPRLVAVAFAAMCAQDLLATVMVVFESRYNWLGAGLFDMAQWITWLVSSTIALDEVLDGGWRSRRARVVIAAVSAANFAGTAAGVFVARAIG